MKQWMVLAALAASSTACVANQGDAPVRLLAARSLRSEGGACAVGDRQLLAGSLDVSGGSSYLLGLSLEANLVQQNITIGGNQYSGPGLSDVTLSEVVVTYESQPRVALPREERIPVYALIRPGTSANSFLLLYGIGPKALTVLRDAVSSDQPVTVLSTIKAVGQMSSGHNVETNEITFPITVINSGYDPAGRKCSDTTLSVSPTAMGACNQLGQDTGPICVPPT